MVAGWACNAWLVIYLCLYILLACWADDPDERPTIQQVISSLKSIISQEQNDEISSIIHKEIKIELQNENSSPFMPLDNEINDLVISDYYYLDAIENNKIPPYILKQVEKLFDGLFDLTDNTETVINKLIKLLIKIQDEKGYNFMETNQIIDQSINHSDQTSSNIFSWLMENQTKPQYIFLLGFLYYHGINLEKDSNKAFELFSKASEDNYSIAQVYLSKCYQTGMGTEINSVLAITYLHNAIENNSICGQLYLGNLYEDGIGTDVDLNQAFYWYEKAANSGNMNALYHIAKWYQYGKGIEKNKVKAFEIYKILSEQENVNAQYSLGCCYQYGIGTEVNYTKAFELYEIAAEEGNYY